MDLDGSCTFCRVIRGDLESWSVLDAEDAFAFLDRRPLFHGHCLLVPRVHFETLPELPAELVGPLFRQVQRLATAVQSATRAQGTFIALNNRVSQSVPHLHVHVVPRNRKDGLRGFFWPRAKYDSAEQMRQVRDTIRAALRDVEP